MIKILKTFILQITIVSLLMPSSMMAGNPKKDRFSDAFQTLGLEMPENQDVHSLRLLRKEVDALEGLFFSEKFQKCHKSPKPYHRINQPWGALEMGTHIWCNTFNAPECQWEPFDAVREWIREFYPDDVLAVGFYGAFPNTMMGILERLEKDNDYFNPLICKTINSIFLRWTLLAVRNLVTQDPWKLIDCSSQPDYYRARALLNNWNDTMVTIKRGFSNTPFLRELVDIVDPVGKQLWTSLDSDQMKVNGNGWTPNELIYYLVAANASEVTFAQIVADVKSIRRVDSIPFADRPRLKSKAIFLHSLLGWSNLPPALRDIRSYRLDLLLFIFDPTVPTLAGQKIKGYESVDSLYWSEALSFQYVRLYPRWDSKPNGLSSQRRFRWSERYSFPTPSPVTEDVMIPGRIPHASLEEAFRARRQVLGEDPAQVVVPDHFEDTKINPTRPLQGKSESWNMRKRPDDSWIGPKEFEGDEGKGAAERVAEFNPTEVRKSWERRAVYPESGVRSDNIYLYLRREPWRMPLSLGQKWKAARENAREDFNKGGRLSNIYSRHNFRLYKVSYKDRKDPARPGVQWAAVRERMVRHNDLYGGYRLSNGQFCYLFTQPWAKAGTHSQQRLAEIDRAIMYGPADTAPRKSLLPTKTPTRKWPVVDAKLRIRYVGEEGDQSYAPVPWSVEGEQLQKLMNQRRVESVPSA